MYVSSATLSMASRFSSPQSSTQSSTTKARKEKKCSYQSSPLSVQVNTFSASSQSFRPRDKAMGLRNLKNSCFLNSILQSLASVGAFTDYLDELCEKLRSMDLAPLTNSLHQSIKAIRDRDASNARASTNSWISVFMQSPTDRFPIYDPSPLIREFARHRESFDGYAQQDAEESFVALLNIVDQEHRRSMQGRLGLLSFDSWKDYLKKPSPFEGIIASHLTCYGCSELRSVRHAPFTTLSLPIPTLARVNQSNHQGQNCRSNSSSNSISSSSSSSSTTMPLRQSLIYGIHGRYSPYLTDPDVKHSIASRGMNISEPSTEKQFVSLADCLDEYMKSEVIPEVECSHCTERMLAKKHQSLERGKSPCEERPLSFSRASNPISVGAFGSRLRGGSQEVFCENNNHSYSQSRSPSTTIEEPLRASHSVESGGSTAPFNYNSIGLSYRSRSVEECCSEALSCDLDASEEQTPSMDYRLGGEPSLLRFSAVKQMVISRLPSLLCFHLCRRTYDELGRMLKIARHVDFPLDLSMSKYFSKLAGQNVSGGAFGSSSESIYSLRAVVVHHGDTDGLSGHYSTYGRVSERSWLHFNDSVVRSVSERDVLSVQAYLLFYERAA